MQLSTEELYTEVLSCAQKHAMFPLLKTPAILMVSGGSDSTALLRIVAALKDDLGIGAVRVLHINHLLRGVDSDRDEVFVHELADQNDFEFVSYRLDVAAMCEEERGNLENVARQVRYGKAAEELGELCLREGIEPSKGRILVAHTQNDRVETFYMRSIVGGGLGSLSSIDYVSGRVVRPLLGLTRKDLREYLSSLAQSDDEMLWREDATNEDIEHFRAFVRHEIVPRARVFNPRLEATLCRNLDVIEDEDNLLEEMASREAEGLVEHDLDGTVLISLEGLMNVPLPLQRRIVRRVALDVLPVYARLDNFHVENMVNNGSNVGFVTVLPTNVIVRNEYGKLAFHPRDYAIRESAFIGGWLNIPGKVELPDGRVLSAEPVTGAFDITAASKNEAYVNPGALNGFWVCPSQIGERMCPLGMAGRSKKLSDIFIDDKIPERLRESALVVKTGQGPDEEIVWLAGIRVDERYKITPNAVDIVHLTLKGAGV